MSRSRIVLLLLVLSFVRTGLAAEDGGGAHWKLASTIEACELAQSADVQQDLKLSAKQAKKLQPLVDEWRARYKAFRKANKRANAEAWQEQYRQLSDEAKKALSAAQLARLRQIYFQCEGAAAVILAHEDAAMLFALSKEQRQKLVEIQIGSEKKRADAFKQRMATNKNPLELFQGGAEAERQYLRESDEQALAVLEPAQRDAWQRLIGPAFQGRLIDAKGKRLHPRLEAL